VSGRFIGRGRAEGGGKSTRRRLSAAIEELP